ncbi:hypothetical protein [Chakrabartyella piscis]|uniref:hypothetical protein n=1 Tax=Chakrabartyella piscis TaxID=2918914 RepID=UPI002958BC4A|nr:hypothetical protein [Chakrabartyella piscis]
MELQKKEVATHGCTNQCKCQQKAYGLCGGCGTHNQKADTKELSSAAQELVKQLEIHCYLPVVQFVVQDTTDPMFKLVAYSPVYIEETEQTIEEIRDMGKVLVDLQKKKILTLDYHLPLQGYAYQEYLESEVFVEFANSVVAEMKQEYTGVFATIQKGSMALTQEYLDQIDGFLEEK